MLYHRPSMRQARRNHLICRKNKTNLPLPALCGLFVSGNEYSRLCAGFFVSGNGYPPCTAFLIPTPLRSPPNSPQTFPLRSIQSQRSAEHFARKKQSGISPPPRLSVSL